MDLRYEAYCFADPLFFDEQRDTGSAGDEFAAKLPPAGDGWVDGERNIWRALHPKGHDLSLQGWKIHVSANLENADRVLAVVYAYCIEHRIPFKHLRTRSILLARNSKYAPREASGKLVAIYPGSNQELERVLVELSTALAGESGPYILSDLRYGDGPLYVRYGGFLEQYVEADGARVLAIRKPDGTLVPDKRGPSFHVPEWEPLPDCLVPHLAARKGGDPTQFPYKVKSSLHFSNGGGVYLADRDSDGARVVLKEARPFAGLDRAGTDAVARLRREHDILQRLAGITGIPAVYDLFPVWEHHFLAMEQVPGISLGSWLARNYPLTRREVTEDDLVAYTKRALAMVAEVERLVAEVHERGVVFGDLHPLNILVETDDDSGEDTIALIDFEMAAPIEEGGRPALGAPGFRAPADREGFDIDRHALAAFRLWLFLPLNTLLELAPAKLTSLVQFVQHRFSLPSSYGASILADLLPRQADAEPPSSTELDRADPDWRVVRKSIATAILASATPEREDRLFPGDIEQFRVGGACFAYGAAGVLHALHVTGEGRYPEHERWLLEAVRREPPNRPGFYDGAHGIAYVLENFGHHDAASELLSGAAAMVEQTREHSLDTGLAGIGLNLLHFAESRQDKDFQAQAGRIGDQLAEALAVAAPPGDFARAGLMSGWSGPALLFVRLFERTGEHRWLGLADQALQRDLEECVPADDASLQVRDGELRTLPYVGIGSAGVAMVTEQLAPHLPGASSVAKLPGLRQACRGEFVIHPGLVFGRGGLMTALAMGADRGPDPVAERAVELHLSRLAWYAVPYRDGLAFPGNQLLRLSMDVHTGGAGVLLAIAATLDGTAVLPFFGSTRRPQTPGPPDRWKK
ncbi:class III lanthionine synthetase LanKC [Amycolatopsis nigrescens]|uniref:class III lanthionine synthetase LanKC n=1 Tax=Amycolatopsis nigrescens TaxID=381445 RepID=UPI0003A37804|nr:class III lanthionine synthetase LanKC [Amycolatopsis nigrescens]